MSPSTFRFSFLFCSVSLAAAAQTSAHLPAAPGTPLPLEAFVVTASPLQRSQADLAQATTVLSGAALSRLQQPTLGETLAGQPGVSSTYFGPGASRPVIRGLGGDRIRILENGVGTIDASVVSPDHAVSVEPFLVERIEIVRGPAALLHGSSAVGGVVNLLTHRIAHALPEAAVTGSFDGRAGRNGAERALGGMVDVAAGAGEASALVLHLDGFERRSGDVRIPGFAKDAARRQEELLAAGRAGGPVPEFAHGTIPNTAIDSAGGAAGLSWVTARAHAGLGYSGFDTRYGVPGAEAVAIDLRQRRFDLQAETAVAFGRFSGARLKFGAADYRHAELEDGATGTVFTNRGFDGRAELLHEDLGGLAGVWGVQAGRSDFAARGEEAFLPSSLTRSAAVFVFEEAKVGAFTPQFGARLERQSVAAVDGRGRTDTLRSGSLGTVWNPAPGWVLAFSVARTERAPNAQELFADGPHAGTGAFEVGDPALGRERSTGLELVLRKPAGRLTGELALYQNRFRGYITEVPTGRLVVERNGQWVRIDPVARSAGEEPLTEYRYAQGGATFRGAEGEIVFHLHETADRHLHFRLTGDLVRATDAGGVPLPRISPARLGVGLDGSAGRWSAGLDARRVFAQRRVAAGEDSTDGHTLVAAHVGYRWEKGRSAWDVFVRGSNLGDAEARAHPSFVKQVAPLPGRNVAAGVRWTY